MDFKEFHHCVAGSLIAIGTIIVFTTNLIVQVSLIKYFNSNNYNHWFGIFGMTGCYVFGLGIVYMGLTIIYDKFYGFNLPIRQKW